MNSSVASVKPPGSSRYALGELYFADDSTWVGMAFDPATLGVGDVTGVRLLSLPTGVWDVADFGRAS